MRRNGAYLIALLFVCASFTMGAGCGGTSKKTDPPSASAQALALADSINLRQTDVPGLSPRFERNRAAQSWPLGNCNEAPARVPIGFLSQRFGRGGTTALPTESVSSGVYLMANETQAVREFDALGSARARACIKHDVERTISEGEQKGAEPFFAAPVEVVSLAPLLGPLPVVGMRRVVRLAIASRVGEGRSMVYLDQSGFVVGRVLVDLLAVGSPHPLPSVTERRLLALLHSRTEANRVS